MASSAEYKRRPFASDSLPLYTDLMINPRHMPQVQFCDTRKRQRSEQCLLNETAGPSQKKQKLARSIEPASNRALWDNLSKIWLTKSALRELDRRNDQTFRASSHQQTRRPITRNFRRSRSTFLNATDYIHSCEPKVVKNIKVFARHGGPDLRDIRNYPEPIYSLRHTMSSKQSSRKRKRKSSAISAYSKNFSQHLIDYNIYPNAYEYPDGSVAADPEGWEEINKRLELPRPSLSPSQFSNAAFRRFTRLNENAEQEAQVRETVLPIIEGRIPDGRCRGGDVPLNNLASLTDINPVTNEILSSAKPDIYYGARPEQLDQRVREGLKEYIIPTKNDRPLAPNFFLEAKAANGDAKVARLQARYDGALGARGMHHLHSYGQEEPVYDNHARTITSTYHDGTLKMYTHHVTKPSSPEDRPEYRMHQLGAYAMTHNTDSFRQGATAYRNARDWAKEQRDEAIERANEVAVYKNAQDLARKQEAASQTNERAHINIMMAQPVGESLITTLSFRTEFSESEPYTLSQTLDVHDSQTASDLHASLTSMKRTRSNKKQSKKLQMVPPAQTRRKRGGKEANASC